MTKHMSCRLRPADHVRTLRQRYHSLLQELEGQQQLRRSLSLRHSLAAALCEVLSWMQFRLEAAGNSSSAAGTPAPAGDGVIQGTAVLDTPVALDTLLQQEATLLQELDSTAHVITQGVAQAASFEALLQPDVPSIAPRSDPMAFLRHTLANPVAGAATMVAADVASMMQRQVVRVSMQLHQLDCCQPCDKPRVLQEVAGTWDSYMCCVASLFALGKYDVCEEAHTWNLETRQPDAAAAAAHQAAQAAAVIPALGLSAQQLEFTVAGMGLYYDLLSEIHAERQQNQEQLAAAEAASNSSSPGVSAAGQQDDLGALLDRIDSINSRGAQLQQQQSLVQRLKVLLQKEYSLRLAVMGWFVGVLTYEQLSRLAVMSWPYAMRVLFLATEIMQQQRHQQQQQCSPPPPWQQKQKQRSV